METVLYALDAAANLMSVSRMTKEGGLNITFTDDVQRQDHKTLEWVIDFGVAGHFLSLAPESLQEVSRDVLQYCRTL